MKKPIPVILDTDIGTDIDDTWALAMMLKSPELDVKLITTAAGDTVYRTKIVAKLLERAGRTDIPIGIGTDLSGSGIDDAERQREWVTGYNLSHFPGKIHKDGVRALINTIMDSREKITLVCIAPLPNIGRALDREPRIALKARFVGMHGSVRVGYGGSPAISKECNVVCHVKECQKVFTAPWDMTITPLDTCGVVQLKGNKYQRILKSRDPLIKALIEQYKIWMKDKKRERKTWIPNDAASSILFDTVAVHLAHSHKFLKIEKLGIRVSDDGYTLIDNRAKKIACATAWKDLEGFEDDLVESLTS